MAEHRGVSSLQAVLFDMDGTLVETESLWYEAETRTMEHFGAEWTAADQELSVGGPFERVAEYMSNMTGASISAIGESLITEMEYLMRTRPLHPLPGVLELHAEVVAAGLPTALVSNSWRMLMDIVAEDLQLPFDVTISGDEVSNPKPAPDPYLQVCAQLGADPAFAVVLEDSATGVLAATEAGCLVVAVQERAIVEPADRRLIVPSLAEVNLASLRAFADAHSLGQRHPA